MPPIDATPPPAEPASAIRAFRRFLCGNAMVLVAMMVGQVAVPWWITLKNGRHDLALYATLCAVAVCLTMPLMSMLGDRHSKRLLIRIGLCVYLLGAIGTACLASFGYYDIRLLLAVEIVALSGLSMVIPLMSVMASDLLPQAALPQAMQQQKFWQSAGQLGGPMLGGLALSFAGVSFALWLQIVLILAVLAVTESLPASPPATTHPRGGWWQELSAGVRAKWRIGLERNWTIITFVVGLALIPCIGMLLPLKVHAMGLSGQWLGICEASVSLGMLLGAAVGSNARIVERLGRFRLRVAAITLLGPALVLVGQTHAPLTMAASLLLVGFMNSIVVMMGYSRRILASPKRFRTRMMAVNVVVTQLSAIVGPALAGLWLMHWPISFVYLIFGITLLLGSAGYWVTPNFRTFLELDDKDVEGWYSTHYPHAFDAKEISAIAPETTPASDA
ncbi:MFS transporter [Dyella acidiphila]|uniref:MFS transporter n=1 Tax=Dyella acidiphila TaxID=2775866 RepID=A0ABR9GDB9_9GAMM|nr:MFS transporter [Dyella acidiphila]MBE1162045.1 MFS transporter [Dyella acidiphila]